MRTDDALVSVVIPAHQAATFIEQTVRSVLAQDHRQLEIIVVDDASTDDTRRILRRLMERDPRIRLVEFESNLGVVAARNRALQEATGAWVAFLDADDVWLPGKISAQLSFVASSPELDPTRVGIGTRGAYLGRRRGPLGSLGQAGDVTSTLRRAGALPFRLSSLMVSRDALLAIGGFSDDLSWTGAEDYDLMVRLAISGCTMIGLPERLMWYRLHLDSVSSQQYLVQKAASGYITLRAEALREQRPVPGPETFAFDRHLGGAIPRRYRPQLWFRMAGVELVDGSILRAAWLLTKALVADPGYTWRRLRSRIRIPARGRKPKVASCT